MPKRFFLSLVAVLVWCGIVPTMSFSARQPGVLQSTAEPTVAPTAVASSAGRLVHIFGGTGAGNTASVAFSPDGKTLLANAGGDEAILWEVATGRQLRYFVNSYSVYSVAFSPDGKTVLTGGEDG